MDGMDPWVEGQFIRTRSASIVFVLAYYSGYLSCQGMRLRYEMSNAPSLALLRTGGMERAYPSTQRSGLRGDFSIVAAPPITWHSNRFNCFFCRYTQLLKLTVPRALRQIGALRSFIKR